MGILLGLLALGGASRVDVFATIGFCTAFTYLAGLLVYARRAGAQFQFIDDGGVGGAGYISSIRGAKRSVLLQHVDDDAPNAELLGTYRHLLDAGVLLRRIIFLRPDAKAEGLTWIREFGPHVNLEQRIVQPNQAQLMRWSFAVIDEREVVVSMPGIAAVDAESYAAGVVLRHVMLLRDRAVASAFVRIHEHVWRHATRVTDVLRLGEAECCPVAPAPTSSGSAPARDSVRRSEEACSSKPRERRRS